MSYSSSESQYFVLTREDQNVVKVTNPIFMDNVPGFTSHEAQQPNEAEFDLLHILREPLSEGEHSQPELTENPHCDATPAPNLNELLILNPHCEGEQQKTVHEPHTFSEPAQSNSNSHSGVVPYSVTQ